jgi:hypothetical protein
MSVWIHVKLILALSWILGHFSSLGTSYLDLTSFEAGETDTTNCPRLTWWLVCVPCHGWPSQVPDGPGDWTKSFWSASKPTASMWLPSLDVKPLQKGPAVTKCIPQFFCDAMVPLTAWEAHMHKVESTQQASSRFAALVTKTETAGVGDRHLFWIITQRSASYLSTALVKAMSR